MTDTECNICGMSPVGTACYSQCPNSVHYYTAEQEREDDKWAEVSRDHITEAYAATVEPSQYDEPHGEPAPGEYTIIDPPPPLPADDNDIPF